MLNNRYLELEVISGSNLVIPSHRVPTGFYVSVSTAYGQWNTTVKTAMADCSVTWNEIHTIQARPLMFPRWLMPIFSKRSKAVHLEIRASFETIMSSRDELVGRVETTLKELLVHDGPFEIRLPGVNAQCSSLLFKTKRVSRLSDNQTQLRAKNVVIFGNTGSGKSSVINTIAHQKLAVTSSNADRCTLHYQRHEVKISGESFVLWDTVGLDDVEAEENLKNLLRELTSPGSNGVCLLVYCVRNVKLSTLRPNYNRVYSEICREKFPIVVVVTGLDNYGTDREMWWNTNGDQFAKRGMNFKDHACVTTFAEDADISEADRLRISESRKSLRTLILKNYVE